MSPQPWAMSVALDDQGEIVPSRGTTSSSSPASPPPGASSGASCGPYSRRRTSTACSAGVSSPFDLGKVDELGLQPRDLRHPGADPLEETLEPEGREGA